MTRLERVASHQDERSIAVTYTPEGGIDLHG